MLWFHRRQHISQDLATTTLTTPSKPHSFQPAAQQSPDKLWDCDADWDAASDEWTVADQQTSSPKQQPTQLTMTSPSKSLGERGKDSKNQILPDPEEFLSASEEEEFGSGISRGVKLMLLQPALSAAPALHEVLQPSTASATANCATVQPFQAPAANVPVMLSQFPLRPLCVPFTQPPVWLTPDRSLEQQAQFEALAGDPNGKE